MRALNDVIERGLVRYIGASSVRDPFYPAQVGRLLSERERRGELIIGILDGMLGISKPATRRREARLASIREHAKLLQPHLPRRRARDDSLLPGFRRGLDSGM